MQMGRHMLGLRDSSQSDAEGTSLLGPDAVIKSFETLTYYTSVNDFNLHVCTNLARFTPNVAFGYVITASYEGIKKVKNVLPLKNIY